MRIDRQTYNDIRSVDFLILDSEISPKKSPEKKKVDARVKARADTLSGRTAFGDASESDAESDSCHFVIKSNRIMNKIILSFILALAAITADAQFLFRISGNGMKEPSYILGTIHYLPG